MEKTALPIPDSPHCGDASGDGKCGRARSDVLASCVHFGPDRFGVRWKFNCAAKD